MSDMPTADEVREDAVRVAFCDWCGKNTREFVSCETCWIREIPEEEAFAAARRLLSARRLSGVEVRRKYTEWWNGNSQATRAYCLDNPTEEAIAFALWMQTRILGPEQNPDCGEGE